MSEKCSEWAPGITAERCLAVSNQSNLMASVNTSRCALRRKQCTHRHTSGQTDRVSYKRMFPCVDTTTRWLPGVEEVDCGAIIPSLAAVPSHIFYDTHISSIVENTDLCSLDTDISNHTPAHLKTSMSKCRRLSDFSSSLNHGARIFSKGCPLPELAWGNAKDVWSAMKKKEESYRLDKNMLRRHPHLTSRMRAILLDWLVEVCEVYRLHRETFQLALYFVDKFLCTQINIEKDKLQLIGITALFIASKLEEIYPPKMADFAYVTDGACAEWDITHQELVMLKALHWDLAPMTVNTWMCVYLQLIAINGDDSYIKGEEVTLATCGYTGQSFVEAARLIDLLLLDSDSLRFTYSQLAASVLYHYSDPHTTTTASGYAYNELIECIEWITPYAIIVKESPPVHMKTFENVMFSDCHNIQTHVVDLDTLDRVHERQGEIENSYLSPLRRGLPPHTLLTPPSSNRKSKPRILRT